MSVEAATSSRAWGKAVDIQRVVLFVGLAILLSYLLTKGIGHWVITLFIMAWIAAISFVSRRAGIISTLIYLGFLGDIRRLVNWFLGWPHLDPLLLVAPLAAFLIASPTLLHVRLRTPLEKAVALLMVWMAIEIVNPEQGGVLVGVGGALFYLVPMLWFWIGRRYGDEALIETVAFKVIVPISLIAAALAFWQQFVGFLPWETAWIQQVKVTYAALNVGGAIRPFAFFTSAASYVTWVAMASSIIIAGWWIHSRRWMILFLMPFVAALFLESGRGIVVKVLVAAAVMWAVRGRHNAGWYGRFVLGLIIAVVVLKLGLVHLLHVQAPNAATADAIQHEVGGLSHPLNAKDSTLGVHLLMMVSGLKAGFTHPFGSGLGATTLAGAKFGHKSVSSEVDVSNMFISLGLPGGILYLGMVIYISVAALKYWWQSRSIAALLIIGVLVSTGGAWLISGQYGSGALVWLFIGALERLRQAKDPVVVQANLRGLSSTP